jgi:hypothetical protein
LHLVNHSSIVALPMKGLRRNDVEERADAGIIKNYELLAASFKQKAHSSSLVAHRFQVDD